MILRHKTVKMSLPALVSKIYTFANCQSDDMLNAHAGTHPGFLEMGFMYKGVGVRFADFNSFFLNIPWKRNNLVSFHFHRIFFKKKGEGVRANPLSSNPLNPFSSATGIDS